ncbi:MAG: hypothetical protein HOI23_09305, partial [Deltaproteobacteria bacterium]|nr:hypothetical protein [Deltaproteobacteria bacterium]
MSGIWQGASGFEDASRWSRQLRFEERSRLMVTARIAAYLKNNGWLLNLVFIALGSYFVGGAVNAVVAEEIRLLPNANQNLGTSGKSRKGITSRKAGFSSMAERNLMALKRENLQPVVDVPEDSEASEAGEFDETDVKSCSLPISVRATLVSDNPAWSIAMIYNNSSRDVEAYSIRPGNNLVVDDAELVEVRSREIIVRRASHYERCLADAESPKAGRRNSPKSSKSTSKVKDDDGDRSKGVTKVSETDYNIEGSEIDRVLNNLSEVATKARIVPSFKNGKPNGFKLFSIKPGSIYSKIGLRNGDVIQSVNGHEMNSPDKALEIYQKLK